MNYFICSDSRCGTQGKHFLQAQKMPQRTKVYKQLKKEYKPFTLYSYTVFFDDSTWKVIERFKGGQDYI